MTRSLRAAVLGAAAALLASPSTAQPAADPSLAATAAAFDADVQAIVRLASAAALVHARTGAFPSDAFGILGSPEGAATGARTLALSRLDVTAPPAEAANAVGAFHVVPLPQPYVRDDEHYRVLLLRRPDGQYEVQYRITRERDPDLGGGRLLYDLAGRYAVQSGVGTVCLDPVALRARLDDGTFVPDPATLSDEPYTVRVVPPGEDDPVYFQTTRTGTP